MRRIENEKRPCLANVRKCLTLFVYSNSPSSSSSSSSICCCCWPIGDACKACAKVWPKSSEPSKVEQVAGVSLFALDCWRNTSSARLLLAGRPPAACHLSRLSWSGGELLAGELSATGSSSTREADESELGVRSTLRPLSAPVLEPTRFCTQLSSLPSSAGDQERHREPLRSPPAPGPWPQRKLVSNSTLAKSVCWLWTPSSAASSALVVEDGSVCSRVVVAVLVSSWSHERDNLRACRCEWLGFEAIKSLLAPVGASQSHHSPSAGDCLAEFMQAGALELADEPLSRLAATPIPPAPLESLEWSEIDWMLEQARAMGPNRSRLMERLSLLPWPNVWPAPSCCCACFVRRLERGPRPSAGRPEVGAILQEPARVHAVELGHW